MTSTKRWLPLAEYSMKHQVSISTLRRRIKAEDLEFRLDDGKYFILDDEDQGRALEIASRDSSIPKAQAVGQFAGQQVKADEHRPSLSSDAHSELAKYLKSSVKMDSGATAPSGAGFSVSASSNIAANFGETGATSAESAVSAASRMLVDLKKAYTQVLHEKENQIQALKQEVADLNTLVKVLEFENEKLRSYNR